ncbi:hypothetical protein Tco_0676195 [Tanacetum coccineum]
MSADVARGHGSDGGGDSRPIGTGCRGKGGRKPNRGGRKAGRLGTRGETKNLDEIVKEFLMYYPSWHKIEEEKKARVLGILSNTLIDAPHPIQSLAKKASSSIWPRKMLIIRVAKDFVTLSFLDYLKLYFFKYAHVAVNLTRYGLDDAAIGKPSCLCRIQKNLIDMVSQLH